MRKRPVVLFEFDIVLMGLLAVFEDGSLVRGCKFRDSPQPTAVMIEPLIEEKDVPYWGFAGGMKSLGLSGAARLILLISMI